MTDARYTYTAGMPAARVGWLVARARAVAGIADRDLGATLGVPLRIVRRWERGDLVPTDDEIEAIASACGTRLTELLPRRASVSYDPATGTLTVNQSATTTFRGTFLGASGTLVKSGGGTLILNPYNGGSFSNTGSNGQPGAVADGRPLAPGRRDMGVGARRRPPLRTVVTGD